jgi:hypothetical protein
MKNFIWILTIAVIFASCSNENPENSEAPEETKTETTTEPGHYKASPDAPLVGLWAIEFALSTTKEKGIETTKLYKGRWFDLKPDNTFESGKWQEKNNTGKWNYDAEKKIVQLHFDKEEPIGFEWKIQGQGDRMIWHGNTPNNKKGTQLSLNRETALPQQQ